MAIDPRISLAVRAPNIPQLMKGMQELSSSRQTQRQNQKLFPSVLAQANQATEINQANLDANALKVKTDAQNQNLLSINAYAPEAKKFIQAGDSLGLLTSLNRRNETLISQGKTQAQRQETLDAIQTVTNGNMDQLIGDLDTVEREVFSRGLTNNGNRQNFVSKASAPQTDPETGQVYQTVFNPNTGASERQDIQGAIQRTGAEVRAAEVNQEIAIGTAKGRVERAGSIKAELGERNRQAARAERPLRQALTLIANASQGITGAMKLQLGRLIPGIDVSSEGELDSVFNTLALEQLQSFKGPTTDFEFGVTQDIAGRISDPASANMARVKSLDRNAWVNRREFEQFNKFIDKGGDPDSFSFNFQEKIKSKKGEFTLQQIQDTAVLNNLTIDEVLRKLNASN